MAAIGRSGETIAVGDNIYDNSSKEITPEKVRAALAVLIESNFNLVDDVLKDLKYDSSNTLEQAMPPKALSGKISGINVGENTSLSASGIISSASVIAHNGQDCNIEVNFSQSINGRLIVPTLIYTSGDYNSNNDVCAPVIRNVSSTKITVGLRKVANVGTNITLQIIAI